MTRGPHRIELLGLQITHTQARATENPGRLIRPPQPLLFVIELEQRRRLLSIAQRPQQSLRRRYDLDGLFVRTLHSASHVLKEVAMDHG